MLNLSELKPGQMATVASILTKQPDLRVRIIDMGITPGTKVFMKRLAPFGDPIWINIRGYELSLRKKEAAEIEVIQPKKIKSNLYDKY